MTKRLRRHRAREVLEGLFDELDSERRVLIDAAAEAQAAAQRRRSDVLADAGDDSRVIAAGPGWTPSLIADHLIEHSRFHEGSGRELRADDGVQFFTVEVRYDLAIPGGDDD